MSLQCSHLKRTTRGGVCSFLLLLRKTGCFRDDKLAALVLRVELNLRPRPRKYVGRTSVASTLVSIRNKEAHTSGVIRNFFSRARVRVCHISNRDKWRLAVEIAVD